MNPLISTRKISVTVYTVDGKEYSKFDDALRALCALRASVRQNGPSIRDYQTTCKVISKDPRFIQEVMQALSFEFAKSAEGPKNAEGPKSAKDARSAEGARS